MSEWIVANINPWIIVLVYGVIGCVGAFFFGRYVGRKHKAIREAHYP